MRRSWLACVVSAATAAPGTLGAPGASGRLDLDDVTAPPVLGLDTSAAQRVRQLQEEIERLRQLKINDEDDLRREVRLAGINLRRVAVFLLERGDNAGPAGSPAIVTGACLAAGRGDIDLLPLSPPAGGVAAEPAAAAAVDALRRFNSLAASMPGVDVTDPARLDELLAGVLRPLAEAVERTAGASTVNHWIAAPGSQPAEAEAEAVFERLPELVKRADLDEPGLAALARIADFLKRGAAFEEFRARVISYAALIERALRLDEELRDATWLSDAGREEIRAMLGSALTEFGALDTRERGRERLERLGSAVALAARITTLGDAPATVPLQGRARRDREGPALDMGGIEKAFMAVLVDDSPRGAAAGERLVAVIERMIDYRLLGNVPLPYDLQPVWRALHEDYRGAEAAVLEALPRFTAPGGASDPALVSLIDAQRDRLDDLRYIRSMHEWSDAVREMSPRAAGPFGGQLRRLLAGLGESSQRSAAEIALGDLDRQMRSWFPMPFEEELRRGDPAAVIAAGARQDELVTVIEQSRRDWAEAWAAGAAPPQARRMELLYALARTMQQSAALLRLDQQSVILNRWSAWELDPATLTRMVADVRGRLKLATAAAIDGDDTGLAEQVGRIQVPPVALLSLLAERLEGVMASLPAGALGTMGQSIHGPPPQAWMRERRVAFADFCRYTMEQDFARMSGRQELAERLGKYLDGLAGRLGTGMTP
jgi:hypothetical protein